MKSCAAAVGRTIKRIITAVFSCETTRTNWMRWRY